MLLAQISMKDLNARKLGPQDVILDVRTPAEFAEGHVPGSLNISHELLPARLEELRAYANIYIHCRSGKRAEMAAQTLGQAGLRNLVCVVGSGMPDWVAAGFPVVTGNK